MALNLIFWQSEYKPAGRLGLDSTSTTITVWKWNKISDVRLELFYFKLDLCCAAVDVQLNTGNKAGISRCQKERSSRNLWRLTHSTLLDYGSKTILYFLGGAVKCHSIYWSWTDDMDPDSSFELGSGIKLDDFLNKANREIRLLCSLLYLSRLIFEDIWASETPWE